MFPDDPPIKEIQELLDLERALIKLTPAERRPSPPRPGNGLEKVSPGIYCVDPEAMMERLRNPLPFGQDVVEATRERPAAMAIKLQARDVGLRLYMRGGTYLMQQACIEVGIFGAKLDKWWIGIGEEGDTWRG